MIELVGVGVRFGEVIALHPTNITFRRGEFAVLLGASGAGKSTLLRCLNYLNTPTSGHVIVEGVGDLADPRALHEHRRGTGTVFQQHQLIGRLSALRNVLMGRLGYHSTLRTLFPLSEDDHVIALESLDRVGLLQKARNRVDQLSGGEQQRVGIARAIAQRPRIVLADEPVASLDPATSIKVLSLLKDVCQETKIPAVVSLHQLELARQFADRIVVIAHGRVVYDGASAAISDENLAAIYVQTAPIPRDSCGEPALTFETVTTH